MCVVRKKYGLMAVCAAALLVVLAGCAAQAGTSGGGAAEILPEEEELYTGVAYSLSMGDPMRAIEALEEARRRNPDSLETKQLLVDVLLIAGELDEALLYVNEILLEDADNQDALYSLALIESARGRVGEEREVLGRILELNPASDRARAAMGEILLREKKYAEADEFFSQSLSENPHNLVALMGKGNAHLFRGNAKEAAEVLTRVIEIQPDYPFAYTDRGRAYADQGDIMEADADITKAIELIPDYAWNYYDRGKLRAQSGSTVAALEDLNTALEMDPSISLAYFYRARIYDGMDRVDEAYADYRQAQSMNPKYAYINLPLAVLEYKRENWAQAASYFIKAADAQREDYGCHLLAALCYKKAGDQKKASDYLAKIMGLLPRESLFYHVARYYMQPSSDLFVIQQVQAEKDKILRSRMLFYIAAQYELQNRIPAARRYFMEASGEGDGASVYTEGRLAAWDLKRLEGK